MKAQPWAHVPGRIERRRGHGRVESRSIKVTALTEAQQQALHVVFPGARQLVKIVRTQRPLTGADPKPAKAGRAAKGSQRSQASRARKKITPTREVVYDVTSLDYDQADPDLLAAWVVSHWHIENRVHHVRDVTFCEDASRVRWGSGPQVMAAIRNVVISLARLVGAVNVAAVTRRWSRRGWEALAVLATA